MRRATVGKDFLFSTASRSALESTETPIHFTPEIKELDRKATI
jgi:hypothetical protein